MKVWGMTGGTDGCTHYRISTPLWGLERRGHTVGWRPDLPPTAVDAADVVIGQRVCKPEISDMWQALAASGKPTVYEVDDNLFRVHPSSPAAHKLFSDPDMQARIRANTRVASAVFVSTERLAEVFGEFNDHVYVLPNCVLTDVIENGRTRHGTGQVVVGWSGSSTHAMDFGALAGVFTRVCARNTRLAFHTIGVNYMRAAGIPPNRIRVTRWTDNVWKYYQSIDFDIGVIPLTRDPFNTAKSDVKFVEYAALGIPVIASDYGPYHDSIEHGKTGLLVRRPNEWARHLRDLLADPAMRTEIGDNAREWARTRTIESNAWRWETALEEVIAQ